jgi:hypothetical protein
VSPRTGCPGARGQPPSRNGLLTLPPTVCHGRMMLHAWSLKFFPPHPADTVRESAGDGGRVERGGWQVEGSVAGDGRRGHGGGAALVGFSGDAVFVAPDPLSDFLEV